MKELFASIPILKWVVPPTAGAGVFSLILQIAPIQDKFFWSLMTVIVVAICTAITAIINGVVKVVLGKREINVKDREVTQSGDLNNAEILLKIHDRSMQEMDVQRKHFTATLQESLDKFTSSLIEAREHYEIRFDELRNRRHDDLKELNDKLTVLTIKHHLLVEKLKLRGIIVTNDLELLDIEKT